ncbi:MAG: poly(3-hydroxybutyrate) depolymerase [Hyphomicrobiaceae bacterium]
MTNWLIRPTIAAVLACLLTLAGCSEESPPPPLPKLGARLDETSTSGISSGAYMAGQFQLAHGSLVIGTAIIAGGPYGCAESAFSSLVPGPGLTMLNLNKAVTGCMLDGMQMMGVPDAEWLAEKAEKRAERGEIDPIATDKADRVYLYTGRHDRTVMSRIVRRTADFYRALGVPEENIALIDDSDAGHAFVTETEGLACGRNGAPYVTDCDYDQAGALLTHIYGPIAPPSPQSTGRFIAFDQTAYMGDETSIGLAATGTVYVPNACETGAGCRIHIAFHGCAQNEAAVGEAFTKNTGFARWADTNRLIVLFPQTESSALNPQGCWDWWGYTGRNFLTKDAPQIRAVRRMLDTLAEKGP